MGRHIQTFKDYKTNTVKVRAVECITAQHLRTKQELCSQASSVDVDCFASGKCLLSNSDDHSQHH